MFKGQPKGLYALALANTGERFGYYTMLAIFTLFLQAKFGFSEAVTSNIYAGFLAAVYFMPFIGGILADKFGYGKMVVAGIIVMFAGYFCLAIPTGGDIVGKIAMFGSLLLIAVGTGLFKGNLQVMVGNLYDDPKYSSKRDAAFSLFYMAINIGSLFAPTAATKITEFCLAREGLTYNGEIPALEFSRHYIDVLAGAYHWGFAVACVSLVLSILIYFGFRKSFKHADVTQRELEAKSTQPVVELTKEQTKSRIVALLLVFAVVIFFWMAFQQNGLTLTFFARDYTATEMTGLSRILANVLNLVFIIIAVYAAFAIFQSEKKRSKIIAGLVTLASQGHDDGSLVRGHRHRQLHGVHHRHALGRSASLGAVVHPHRPLRHLRCLHLLHHEEAGKRHQGLTAHSRIAYSPRRKFPPCGDFL